MNYINDLINYSIQNNILESRDKIYAMNQILYLVESKEGFEIKDYEVADDIDTILNNICDAYKIFSNCNQKELFKSKIISVLMDKPSTVEKKFYLNYEISPQHATNYFYKLSEDVNYIKKKQIAKNIQYTVDSKYGLLNISINLSKPEKSLKEIELLKKKPLFKVWPLCVLCKEEEGYYGTRSNPDRSNHRLVAIDLNDEKWYFQYSPFSYYNEHAIILSSEHTDMVINKNTFEDLICFVDMFDHYMIGSNADLPIVGGSMLTHAHYQAGKFEFPIFKASVLYEQKEGEVRVQILNWALSSIRLVSSNKEQLVKKANDILNKWKVYSNEKLNIICKTDEQHNTITPLVRKVNGIYEMILILRNNRKDEEFPDGIFHPHKDKHHIKKENIGIIEASGLAILPGRLVKEMDILKKTILNKKDLPKEIEKHITYYNEFKDYEGNELDVELKNKMGKTFELILEDCSVFKNDLVEFEEFLASIS